MAALAPEHPRALAILGRVREESGAVDQAVALYERAAATEPDRSEKSALLTRAAVVLLERGKDEDRAANFLVRALAADPGHRNANERLVDVYTRREQWDDVEALLDREVAAARGDGEGDSAEAVAPEAIAREAIAREAIAREAIDCLAALETQLARAAIALGKPDKALACLESAHARRPGLLPMLRTFADFRYARGEWTEAVAHYQSLLALHRAAIPAAELPDMFQRIGRAKAELGDADGAIAAYREVRALAPEQRPAIEGLSVLLAAKGDWAAWVGEREALAAVVSDGKGAIWEEIGDACAARLGDRARAEAAYRQALAAEPARRSTIEKLLAIFREDKRAEQTVEMLSALAAVEPSPGTRAQLRREAARLLLDKVNRPLEAAELLERALDDAPEVIEAFDELARLREDATDWAGLVGSHKAMLDWLPPEAPRALRLRLWTRIGNVALRQLRDCKLAMTAFEAAVALDPDDRAKQEMLAHVYETVGPDARTRAIAAHQRLIAHDPHRTDSFLALAKLYGETGETDKRWCVAATLWYLKKNTPALDELFQRHRSPRVRTAQRRFSEESWSRVRHPDEDPRIGEMFAVASPYLASSAAYDPAHVGLKKRTQVNLAHDDSLWARTLVELAGTLALPLPDVYTMEGESGADNLGQRPPPERAPPDAAPRSAHHAAQQLRPGVRSGAALFFLAPRALPPRGAAHARDPPGRPGRAALARRQERRKTRRRHGARRRGGPAPGAPGPHHAVPRAGPAGRGERQAQRRRGDAGHREMDWGDRSVGGAVGAGPDGRAGRRLPRDLQRGDPAVDGPDPPADGRPGGLLGERRLLHAAPRARSGRGLNEAGPWEGPAPPAMSSDEQSSSSLTRANRPGEVGGARRPPPLPPVADDWGGWARPSAGAGAGPPPGR